MGVASVLHAYEHYFLLLDVTAVLAADVAVSVVITRNCRLVGVVVMDNSGGVSW